MTNERAPVLNQINLVVRDMDAMVEFYRRLGVEVQEMGDAWDHHHRAVTMPAGLDLDLDSRKFAAVWNRGWPTDRAGTVIGFQLADRDLVDEAYADLTDAGYAAQQPPYDAFWGSRFAIVEDPDGNSVGLMSPMDPARRSAPPEPPA
jgi:uncharacterized glyoxalase superfamily protein PhnB